MHGQRLLATKDHETGIPTDKYANLVHVHICSNSTMRGQRSLGPKDHETGITTDKYASLATSVIRRILARCQFLKLFLKNETSR